MASDSILEIRNLTKNYGRLSALNGLNLHVRQGEIYGLLGPNGSGKTTLSYCLCGIIPHYLGGEMTGRVDINGLNTRVTPLHRLTAEIGIILQDPNIQLLMPSVEDDIAFGLENHNLPAGLIAEKVDQVMELVGISHLRKENPNRLSGGEKQLVAIATVLALDPPILVFDESLSMLDDRSASNIIGVLKKLKEEGKTMVIIDHTGRGRSVYEKVFVLEEGRVIHRGRKDDILDDSNFLHRHHLQPDSGRTN
ncbi:MAG: energy-coupling factor ABC transporter ATP-binding protein [Bacteroidota bacterium]